MSSKILTIGGIIIAVSLFVIFNAFFIVSQVEQAVVFEIGKAVKTVQEPGLKVKKPFIQDVAYFDKRLIEFNAEPKEVILADQKRLIVDAFVRYRITDPLKFFQTVRDERIMRDRLNSIVESSLRQVMGSVPLATVLSSERTTIMEMITAIVHSQASGKPLPNHIVAMLEKRAEETAEQTSDPKQAEAVEAKVEAVVEETENINHGGFGIEVVDVRLMRADLPKENSQAIYRRMQTEREREAKDFRARGKEEAQKIRSRAENERTVILANATKESDIIRGKGEAEATRVFAEAFGRDEDFYHFYRSLQAYRETLAGQDTMMVMSPKSEFLRFLEEGSQGGRR